MPDARPDPARTLALLWRAETREAADGRRGPRRGLDVDTVVAAALGRADAGGPTGAETLTMRRLADDLGVAAMTLYTYVPGKAELLDLLLDAAYVAMSRTDTAGRPWRERVTAIAEENRALFTAHPWAARASTGRPVLGPGETAKYEHELAAFDDVGGLGDVERDAALTFVLDFARAAATAEAHAAPTGDAAWWAEHGPLLARVLDPARFPRAVRVGSAAGAAQGGAREAEHVWRFGLARVLDGLAPLMGRRRSGVEDQSDRLDPGT